MLFKTLKLRQLHQSSSLPGPSQSNNIAYRAGRGLVDHPAFYLMYQEIEVTAAQETETQPALVQALLRAPAAEQQLLLAWVRALSAIRQGELRGFKKMAAIFALTRERKAGWPLAKVMSRALKHVLWDARSWRLRLGLGAIIAAFVVVGNGAAGIVPLGAGIGLPLWLIVGIGGTLAGVLADFIKKKLAA
jgi:hypothetical protein